MRARAPPGVPPAGATRAARHSVGSAPGRLTRGPLRAVVRLPGGRLLGPEGVTDGDDQGDGGDETHPLLALLAEGYANAEVAAALSMAEATVKTHVSRLLRKLDLRSRTQAAVLAREWGVTRE